MIEVDFYFSTHSRWLSDFAVNLANATGERVSFRDNVMEFDGAFGKGTYHLFELKPGISILLVECILHGEFKFRRLGFAGNDHYRIMFNIGEKGPLTVVKQNGETVDVSKSFANAIFFESQTTEATFYPPIGKPIKVLQLIFERSWAMKRFATETDQCESDTLRQFRDHTPIQYSGNLDLTMHQLVCEMFAIEKGTITISQYLEGCACQLTASFLGSMIKKELGDQALMANDLSRIEMLVKKLEANLGEPLPSLDRAAKICYLNRAKFAKMFKSVYKDTYWAYFQTLRMKKAEELLSQGYGIADTGHMLGYINITHFSKMFEDFLAKESV